MSAGPARAAVATLGQLSDPGMTWHPAGDDSKVTCTGRNDAVAWVERGRAGCLGGRRELPGELDDVVVAGPMPAAAVDEKTQTFHDSARTRDVFVGSLDGIGAGGGYPSCSSPGAEGGLPC
jgi:hypothetical protein